MFTYLCCLLQSLTADRKGVTALEYGLIAAVMVVVVGAIIKTMGTDVGLLFTSVGTNLST